MQMCKEVSSNLRYSSESNSVCSNARANVHLLIHQGAGVGRRRGARVPGARGGRGRHVRHGALHGRPGRVRPDGVRALALRPRPRQRLDGLPLLRDPARPRR